jgi:phytoene/squalene synthetase
LITRRYSTSFSLGIQTLSPKYRLSVYSIYGFVRYADEIVDTFHGYDKRRLFDAFKRDTWQAIADGLSLNPVLDAYQEVVNRYNVPEELTRAFLNSMEMDLEDQTYDPLLYNKYIYGSAEVVGLMCLCVFCDGDTARYEKLTPMARSLGAAFQKVNFLRDMQSDYVDRGRVYFPGVDLSRFDAPAKAEIEADIAADFAHGLQGIKALPRGAGMGVYLAYIYYQRLFKKICRTQPERILNERIRVPDAQKFWLMVQSYARYRMGLL